MGNYIEHIQQLLEGPAQTVGYLGTRDENLQVSATIVFGFGVKANPARVVAYLPEAALGNARRNLNISDYATLLIVNAGTFEGVQVKGNAVLKPGDTEGESFLKMNLKRMMEYYGSEFFKAIRTAPLMAVEITVKEIYDQTPGVGAGEQLRLEEGDSFL
jgi:hypothetical protein